MRVTSLVRSKWDIFASVVLTRPPTIAPAMNAVEARYDKLQNAEEFEKSLLNDFELKSKQDERLLARRAELEREGKELSELDGELGVTNLMRVDEWTKKAQSLEKKYNLSNGVASQSEDDKSRKRHLDRQLIFIAKQRFGNEKYNSPWILPQMKHQSGESLRQTAERCLGEVTSSDLQVIIHGNAPFSSHTHRYPKSLRERTGADGAKIFFYSAQLYNTSLFDINSDEIADYKWVTPEEFMSTVPCRKYRGSVKSAFIE